MEDLSKDPSLFVFTDSDAVIGHKVKLPDAVCKPNATEQIILKFLDEYRISADSGIEHGDTAPYATSAWRLLSNGGINVKNFAFQLSKALAGEEVEWQDWIHS